MQISLFVNVPIGSSSSIEKFIKWNENKELLNKPYWSRISTTLVALLKCPSIFNFTPARKGKGTSLVHLVGWKKSLTSNYQIIFLKCCFPHSTPMFLLHKKDVTRKQNPVIDAFVRTTEPLQLINPATSCKLLA